SPPAIARDSVPSERLSPSTRERMRLDSHRGRQPGGPHRKARSGPEATQRRRQTVNTNGLAKHYESLTPWERVPLILAAMARGDEPERTRLVQSAPRLAYAVQNHAGLADALFKVSAAHFMRLLDLVACYGAVLGAAVYWKGKDAARVRDAALFYGHLFQVRLAG